MSEPTLTVVHGRGVLDIVSGEIVDNAYVSIVDGRITNIGTDASVANDADDFIDLPDLTLLPGLMDMEVDLVLGGPGAGLTDPVVTDPVKMTLRATVNAKRTLRAGFTTVRNLGLFVKTGGYLLDVALAEAVELGWVDGPRIIPAGHAICPTGGHLDPSAQAKLAPQMMPLSVEEGIADGVDEVRRAVRYQIKHGAQLIKCCASGGVMSPTGAAGAQQYSTEELTAIAEEAHRRGLRVATHAHGDAAVNAALDAGIDCIEHGNGLTEAHLDQMVAHRVALVPTVLQTDKFPVYVAAARGKFPAYAATMEDLHRRRRDVLMAAYEAGVALYVGSDGGGSARHGCLDEEIVAMVEMGLPADYVLGAASWRGRA